MEFPVVELDGALVLLAAVHGLPLAVALDLLGDLGHGDRQRERKERKQKDDPEQNVALFRGACAGGLDWVWS